jgi:hypothetical protein
MQLSQLQRLFCFSLCVALRTWLAESGLVICSQAPPGVVLSGRLQLPYAAPYVPPPSLPPPEYAHLPASGAWVPGRRRALLVAANYSRGADGGARLRGCVNDVHCLKHLLTSKFGCGVLAS